jgi:KipI family sensor histidine kinase inhibitor
MNAACGSKTPALRMSELGAGALLFESDPPLSHTVQEKIWHIGTLALAWPGVREAVPGMNNVMLVLDPLAITPQQIRAAVEEAWTRGTAASSEHKTVELDVNYGGEHGPDLAEVAQRAGLSVTDAVDLHTQARYTVYFLGAHPGFAYLGGLDPRLHTPRRAQPRLKVPAGTVAIGGTQAGTIAQTSPSGWQLIGYTDRRFFDPSAKRPALLEPGDVVLFRCVKVLK